MVCCVKISGVWCRDTLCNYSFVVTEPELLQPNLIFISLACFLMSSPNKTSVVGVPLTRSSTRRTWQCEVSTRLTLRPSLHKEKENRLLVFLHFFLLMMPLTDRKFCRIWSNLRFHKCLPNSSVSFSPLFSELPF